MYYPRHKSMIATYLNGETLMVNVSKRRLLIGGGTFITLTGAGLAYNAFVPHTYRAQTVYISNGIALGGTDTVAYFTHGKPVAGSQTKQKNQNCAPWI